MAINPLLKSYPDDSYSSSKFSREIENASYRLSQNFSFLRRLALLKKVDNTDCSIFILMRFKRFGMGSGLSFKRKSFFLINMIALGQVFSATSYQASSTSAVSDFEVNTTTVLTSTLFTNNALNLSDQNNNTITSGLSLGYIGSASSGALQSGDTFALLHSTNNPLTLTFDVDASQTLNILPALSIATNNEKLVFSLGSSSVTQLNGSLSGAGVLATTGSGALNLNGSAASFSGELRVGAGSSVQYLHSASLPAVVQIANGATFTTASSLTAQNVYNSGLLVMNPSTGTQTISGTITGSGEILKQGAGSTVLSVPTWYTGATQIDAGTLTFTNSMPSNGLINNGQLILNLSNGTSLAYSGAISGNGNIVINGSGSASLTLLSSMSQFGGSVEVNGGGLTLTNNSFMTPINLTSGSSLNLMLNSDLTYSSAISGAGVINCYGTNQLTLSGTASYHTLNLNDCAGVLNQASMTGNINHNGLLSVTITSAPYNYTGMLTGTAPFIKSGTGNLQFAGGINHPGLINLSAGAITLYDQFYVGNIPNSGQVIFNLTGSNTYENLISGTGSVTLQGSGSLTMLGLQTYSGGTTVAGGALTVYSQGFQGDYNLSGSSSNASLTAIMRDASVIYSNTISGTGSFAKQGLNDLIIQTPQTYTGRTTVQEGRLNLQYQNALSSQTDVTILSSGSILTNNNALSIGTLAGAGNLSMGSGNLSVGNNNNSAVYSGVVSGSGQVTKNGTGSWTLQAPQTYTGLTAISAGSIIAGVNQIIPATNDISLTTGSVLNLAGYNLTLNSLLGSGSVLLGSGSAALTINNSNDFTYNGAISGTGSVTKNGTGQWTLGAYNIYTGATNVNNGTLTLGVSGALPSSTALTVGASGTLNFASGISQSVAGLAGSGSITLGTGTLTINGGSLASFSGSITGQSTSAVRISNASGLTLSGSLTGLSGAITVDSGSVLTLNNTIHSGSINLNGSLYINPATGQMVTIGTQAISGSGSLFQNGIGTLIVNRNLTYTGSTVLSAGTTTLNNVTLATSDLTNSAVLSYVGNTGTAWTIPYSINNSGTITVTPSTNQTITYTGNWTGSGGVTNLSGNVVYQSSNMLLNNATVSIASGANVISNSTHSLTTRGASTLAHGVWNMNGATINTTGASSAASWTAPGNNSGAGLSIESNGLSVNTNDADLSLYMNISGLGGLTKTGSHTLYLLPGHSTGYSVNYTGPTTVSQGSLAVNDLFNSTSNITLAANTNLLLSSASSKTFVSNISGAGNIRITSGEVTLSGVNTYLGTTSIDSGATLAFDQQFDAAGQIITYGRINITVPNGQTYILQNTFSGQGSVYKYGGGNLVLGGDFTNLIGTFNIVEGQINFVSNPPSQSSIQGSYTITTNTDTASVWTLYADTRPIQFGGVITGLAGTRFRVSAFKSDDMLSLAGLQLSGILDVQVIANPSNQNAIIDGTSFRIQQLNMYNNSGINFQFDQSDASGITKPMLTYDNISIGSGIKYYLQALNQSDVFSNRTYQLMQLNDPTDDDIAHLISIAETIRVPAVFEASFDIDAQDPAKALLSVTLTKLPAGSVLSRTTRAVSIRQARAATSLQSLGTSSAPLAQNAAQVLELAGSPDELLSHVNNFLPTGNRKSEANMQNSQTAAPSAQSTMSSHQFRAFCNRFNKLANNKKMLTQKDHRSLVSRDSINPFTLYRKVMSPVYTKYYKPSDEGDQQSYDWVGLLDGLQLAGVSVSAETNYVHQETPDVDPNNPGSNFNIWGATVGASNLLQEKYVVGILGSYFAKRIELHPNELHKTSLTQEKVHSIAAFLAYQDLEQPYYASFYMSAGRHHYNTERTWQYSRFQDQYQQISYVNSRATNQHLGYDITGSMEFGYTYIINQETALQPFVGAGFVTLREPGYSEESYNVDTGERTLYGSYYLPNQMTKQSRTFGIHAIQSIVSGDQTYQFSTRMSYVTERVNGDTRTTYYAYLYDTNNIIPEVSENKRQGAFEMSLALNASYANQWIISGSYTGHFGEDLKSHTAVATVQYMFG